MAHVRVGSSTDLSPPKRDFRSSPNNRHEATAAACSARSLHPKLFHRKNFIPRTDIIQNYRVGGCQTLNFRLVLCRKDRQPPSTFGIFYRAVTHDRTNFGQALKVVAVSLHDVLLALGHRLYEVRARQDHFAQEEGHLSPLRVEFNKASPAC